MNPRAASIPALLFICLGGLSVGATAETDSSGQTTSAIPGSPVTETSELTLGEDTRGLLGRNAPVNPADGAPYRVFTIDLEPGDPVRFEVTAPNTQMNPSLTLYAPDGTLLGTNRHDGPRRGERSPALVREPVMAGRHTLVVTGARAGAQGSFTLSAEIVEDTQSLSFPGDVSGHLHPRDGSHPQTGSPRVVYTFELDEATVVDAHMQSEAFDTYLSIAPADGSGQTHHNDDGGQGTDSRIQTRLPAGEYEVWAGSYYEEASGPFSLVLDSVEAEERESLSFPGDVSGQLYQGEGNHPQTGSPRVVYTFELDEATVVDARMQSEAFDTYLSIAPVDGDGRTYHNDDWGQGLNSRVQTELPPGEYEVWAGAFSEGATGPFTLSLDEQPQQEQESLTFPGEVSGHLYQSDSSHPQTGSPRVVYTFDLDEATVVDAHMVSEAFDTYLSIAPVDGDGQTYHNDDWGQELNSRIRTELPAGEYEVWASAYSQEASGAFTLSVEAGTTREQEPLTAGDERRVRISEDMLLTMPSPSGATRIPSGAPFPIRVEESGRLEVTIETQGDMPYASLRQNGRTLAENTGGVEGNGPLTLRTPVEAGEYTLWLSPGSRGSAGFDGTVDLATRMDSGKG